MRVLPGFLLAALASAGVAPAADYARDVEPFLRRYCYECHGADSRKGGLAFHEFPDEAALKSVPEMLETTLFVLEEMEMPPKAAPRQPAPEERAAVITWLHETLAAVRNAAPNDPGLVVMPRLNHREYARVVQDLTGRPIDIGSLLVPDGSAGEGFLNVGQAQQMSVEQFEGFLGAARALVQYAMPSPTGDLFWSTTPMPTRPEPARMIEELRRGYADAMDRLLLPVYNEHLRWLREMKMPVGLYLEACWRYQYRRELGLGADATFADVAQTFEQPLFASSIERLWNLLHWENLPRDPQAQPIKDVRRSQAADSESDYMINVLNLTAKPREFVEQNYLLQNLFAQWHALAPPNGAALDQRRADARKLQVWLDAFRGGRGTGSEILSKKPRPKAISERDFRSGFVDRESFTVDLSLVKGDFIYLMISDCYDGNDTDFVQWQGGEVIWPDGTRKPWHEVFADVTDQAGRPVRWGFDAKGGAIAAAAIGVQAPSILKVRVPESARKAELQCSVTFDPQWGLEASTQNDIDHKPRTNLHWFGGRRTLGKLRSQRSAVADGASGILKDPFFDLEYRAYGSASDEEEDWLTDIQKDAALYAGLTEEQARSLGIPWPLRYNVAFHATWPLQFQFPEDYRPLMTAEQRAEFDRLTGVLASFGSPAETALADGLRAAGIKDPEDGAFPSEAQLAAVPAESQAAIRRQMDVVRAEHRAQRAVASRQLGEFMRRAWRGPVSPTDVERVLAFYDRERAEGRHFVNGMRAAMLPVLIHPRFLYRSTPATGEDIAALGNEALASRLSFMLWGSVPDEELLRLAETGEIRRPEVLQAQVKRMLADPRSEALATEFVGLWLQFADFREAVSPDLTRFKGFTPSLKEAMYREPVRFFQELFRNDDPLTDALFARHTYLNEELARHYGIEGVKGREMRRVALEDPRRGGVLGMGAILTKTSTPLRTSPVFRGHWLYSELLGIHMPPPPPNVPQLSDGEVNEEGLSVREQLEEHRRNPSCFSCHDRLDPLGIALENFNPVGQWREKDTTGAPVDNQGKFVSSGRVLDGLDGLREYLRENQDRFVETFCRKLLGYALGRAVEVTDKPLIDEMVAAMKAREYRPSAALQALVVSPQFLNHRQRFADKRSAAR